MKKTFMTFLALGFACSVSFAQEATPAENTTQKPVEQKEVKAPQQDARKQVKMEELPAAVKQAFTNGEYKDMEVLAIYIEPATETAKAAVFEFELAKSAPEAAAGEEVADLEIERVSNRQPDVVLFIDENGKLLKENDLDATGAPKK